MSPHQRVSIAVGSGVKSRRTRSGRRAARGSGIVVRCRRPRWRGDFVGVRRSACRPAQHVILIPGRIGDAACAALVLNGSWKRSPLRKPHWAGFFHHRPRHLPALSPHVSGVDKSQRSALTPSQGRYAMAVSGCGLRWWLVPGGVVPSKPMPPPGTPRRPSVDGCGDLLSGRRPEPWWGFSGDSPRPVGGAAGEGRPPAGRGCRGSQEGGDTAPSRELQGAGAIQGRPGRC